MADHPDHFLPRLHFLSPQFGGEHAQQNQFVAAAVETEAATRKMVDFLLVRVADRENGIATALERIAHASRHACRTRRSSVLPVVALRRATSATPGCPDDATIRRSAASPPGCAAPSCRAAVPVAPVPSAGRARHRQGDCGWRRVHRVRPCRPTRCRNRNRRRDSSPPCRRGRGTASSSARRPGARDRPAAAAPRPRRSWRHPGLQPTGQPHGQRSSGHARTPTRRH